MSNKILKAANEKSSPLKKELVYLESQVKRVKKKMEESNKNKLELQPLLEVYEAAVEELKKI
ncbi:MAG: hypothetical protein CL760_06485 [Chloroflexi bacterium]|nr:hypothetical protein [Chloroflexota bacterium]|tara:strand:- start:7817 stop:8002 length:186 start_codon:yes stop_codon:yes gene_type:complete